MSDGRDPENDLLPLLHRRRRAGRDDARAYCWRAPASKRRRVGETNSNYLRDFRSNAIHPSTLEAMHELGLLEDFLKLPHQEVQRAEAKIGDVTIPMADFSHLPTHAKFVGSDAAMGFPGFPGRDEPSAIPVSGC